MLTQLTGNRSHLSYCLLALKRCILLQTRIHIMTISQHNSVLHTFSVTDWSEMCGEITPLFSLFFHCKKCVFFFKFGGLWLVGEVVNHVGLYGSKVAEGWSAFQRRSCLCSHPQYNQSFVTLGPCECKVRQISGVNKTFSIQYVLFYDRRSTDGFR